MDPGPQHLVDPVALAACTNVNDAYDLIDAAVREFLPTVSIRHYRSEILGMLNEACPPLRAIDVFGINASRLFEVDLAEYIPKGVPLDVGFLGTLHGLATDLVELASPELAERVLSECSLPEDVRKDSRQQQLRFAYFLWGQAIYLPLMRGPDAPTAVPLSSERAKLLNLLAGAIRALSPLTIDAPRMKRSALEAIYPGREQDAERRASLPGTANAVLEMLNAESARASAPGVTDLSHFLRARNGDLIVNLRGVRDRYGERLGIPRVRAKSPMINEHAEEADVRAHGAATPDLAPADLATLREIRDRRDESRQHRLAADLLDMISGGDSAAAPPEFAGVVAAFLRCVHDVNDPALKAAIAHRFFGARLTRKDLATHFRCTEREMEGRRAQAAQLVARERSAGT